MVFPFLSEIYPVNHSVDVVVAYVRVYLLNQRVHFDGSQRSPRKQVLDGAAEDGLVGFAPRAETKNFVIYLSESTCKSYPCGSDDLAFGCPVLLSKIREIYCERGDFID